MTPQEVIKNFMAKLANQDYEYSSSVGKNMLDAAVRDSSRFLGTQNVIDSMKSDQIKAEKEAVEEILGSDYAGKTISQLPSSVLDASTKNSIDNRKATIFLEKYCGIILDNADTGAITGSDANITLAAGDVIYDTTLTADDLLNFAKQEGMSLSGDKLIIGTGVEKTASSVVPEIGNKYTATTSQAQNITTGSNDWLVVATSANDTITTGGADSIDAGAGNDKISIGADYASILTGAGNDTVEISSEIKNVTLGDLDSNDVLTIGGTFSVGSAQVENNLLVVKDKTGTREIRLGNLASAKDTKVNKTTLAKWLSTGGIDINALETISASANVIEESLTATTPFTEDGTVQINGDENYKLVTNLEESTSDAKIQTLAVVNALSKSNVNVDLDNVTLLSGDLEVDGSKVGEISSEFPNITKFTKRGLTITLHGIASSPYGYFNNLIPKTLDELEYDKRAIVAGLFKWWTKESLKLIEESYGIGFSSSKATVKDMGLYFHNGSSVALATVWYSSGDWLELAINMNYYEGMEEDNVGGITLFSRALDRTLAHEFTHAVMSANISQFRSLPQFIKEGMAELTCGIDGDRGSKIFELAHDSKSLANALNIKNSGTGEVDAYAGGYMFLRYFAKQATLQLLVDYENPEAGAIWAIEGTTATYKIDSEVAATIEGLKSGLAVTDNTIDGILVRDGIITLSKKVLDTSKVTLTSTDYKLELADDVEDVTTKNTRTWSVNKGTAILKGDVAKGYSLAADKKSITYSSKEAKNKEFAKITGLAKTGLSATDFNTSGGVITLKKSMLGTSKVIIKGDGYTLALASNVSKPVSQPAYWTYSGTTATYKQNTTAGFTLAEDNKSATYSKQSIKTLATVSGLKKAKDNKIEGISISGDVIKLNENALGTSKVSVKGNYTLSIDDSLKAPAIKDRWGVSGTTATYDKVETAYFKPSADNKTLTYNKEKKINNLVTVKGMAKGTKISDVGQVQGIVLSENKIVTLAGNELFGNKVEVKLAEGYTLNNQLSTPSVSKTYWAVKNGTAILKQDKTGGYTLTENAKTGMKTLTYSAPKTVNVATVSGLNKNLKDANGVLEGLSYDLASNVVTVDKRVLGASKVSIKEKNYKLNLVTEGNNAAPTTAIPATIWAVSGTKAVYKNVNLGYFTRKDDKTLTYNKEKTIKTLATINGLKKNASPSSFSINGDVITLSKEALTDNPTAKTKITLGKKDNYTLKLGGGVASVEYNNAEWSYSKNKATLTATVKAAGYLLSDDEKTITYTPTTNNKGNAITKTYATLSGVKSKEGISVAGNVISLTETALNNKKVTLGKNEPYTLALGNDSLAPSPETDEIWKKNGTKATLTITLSKGYSLAADAKTINYSAKSTTKTLATINGINKNADLNTFAAVADGDNKKISLSANQLGKKVTVSSSYEFDFASDYKDAAINGSSADDTITVAGTGLSVTGGKGNDAITFGGARNTFFYASGDGNDVIANFTASDKIKITKGTPNVSTEGSDVVVKIGNGSIKLAEAAGQSISILDNKNKLTTYATNSSAAYLLEDDNFKTTAPLNAMVNVSGEEYSPGDLNLDHNRRSLTPKNNLITYGNGK